MRTDQPIERAANAVAAAGESVAEGAERGIAATRAVANNALDEAGTKVQGLRDDLRPSIEALSARVQHLAEHAQIKASRVSARARQALDGAAQNTSAHVAEKPLQSIALAAAAGAVLAMLLGRRR